jgi:hypothetical protein
MIPAFDADGQQDYFEQIHVDDEPDLQQPFYLVVLA